LAAQYAKTIDGTLYIPPGSYRISALNYLHFGCNVDASKALVRYIGGSTSGAILTIGGDESGYQEFNRSYKLPDIEDFWQYGTVPSTTNVVGVQVMNTRGCDIQPNHIYFCGIGMLFRGAPYYSFYDNIQLGTLFGNFKQLYLADGANQETFVGGSIGGVSVINRTIVNYVTNIVEAPPGIFTTNVLTYSHDVYATNMGSVNITTIGNNNTFVGTSVEGDNSEYMLDLTGPDNQFLNCRFEVIPDYWNGPDESIYHADTVNNARVRVNAGAAGNMILGGNYTEFLQITQNGTTYGGLTVWAGRAGFAISGASPYTAPLTLYNMWGSGNPTIQIPDSTLTNSIYAD
jgi:hypothetical protein